MCDLQICRICLNKNVKLFNLEQYNLKQYYEQIMQTQRASPTTYQLPAERSRRGSMSYHVTDFKFWETANITTEPKKDESLSQKRTNNTTYYLGPLKRRASVLIPLDQLPRWFCFECASLLHKYHKFKEKCSYGQDTLHMLLSKELINYEMVENIRKNREDLQALDYIITNKNIKTYHIKHKKHTKPSQIENILIEELTNEIKNEYVTETDDEDTSLDKISKKIKTLENILQKPDYDLNNFDNDDFDLHSIDLDVKINTNFLPDYQDTHKEIANDEVLDNKINAKNSLLLSLLSKESKVPDITLKPSVLKTPKLLQTKEPRKEKPALKKKPLKFEKIKIARINKDNWDIKILTEEEAVLQFRQRINNSRYIKFQFKCEKCIKGFSKKDILLRHNKQCHDEGSFECRFCHALFKRKFQLGRHMMVHYYVYQCLRCDLKCNLLSTAAFHEDSHNGVLRTCQLCGEQFKHVSTYYTHLRVSHRNSHVCKLCGASFVSEIGLDFHMKRQHCISENTGSETTSSIYCEKCDVSFISQGAFDEHLFQSNLHEAEQPTPKRKRNRTARLENATTCRYCKTKFVTRAECRKHVSTEHRGEKQIHGDSKPALDRVMCEICGAWLAAASIEVHMNRHTKKKVYPCPFCGKEFLCKSGYNTHQAKHTGVRPHSCKICLKRFSQKFAMEIHYRRVHLKEPYPKRNRKKNSDEVPLFEKMKW